MKTAIIFLIALSVSCGILAQKTYIPDDNFEQALIDLGIDSGALDDSVFTASISDVIELEIDNRDIAELTGIEDFIALRNLWCYFNKLTTLDLSQNPDLKQVHAHNNQLTQLDVGQNPQLFYLGCGDNLLSSLDVSSNLELTDLNCNDNLITNLDLSHNLVLEELWCGQNQLTTLDLSACSELNWLTCYNNQLTSLDVSKNPLLTHIDCGGNRLLNLDLSNNVEIVTLYCDNNQLTDLDVTANIELKLLNCLSNQLVSLNLKNGKNSQMTGGEWWEMGMGALYNPNLICIEVDDPEAAVGYEDWSIDEWASYSEDCGASAVTYFKEFSTVVNVFPNPASGTIHVDVMDREVSLIILDLNGKLILHHPVFTSGKLDLSSLNPGIYVARISDEDETGTFKLIVQ